MDSGIAVPESVSAKFAEMKLKKFCGYMILRVTKDEKAIEVEKFGKPGSLYADLLEELQELLVGNQCRYIICDFKNNPDEQMRDGKMILFLWSPETASVKHKIMYTTTFDKLKHTLGTGFRSITARHCMDDMDIKEIASSF